jgi:peroxiredoxin
MSNNLVPGAVLPDFVLPDSQTGLPRRLSELQGQDPMILLLGRGEHCPRERQHQREMLKLYEWCAVAYTHLVTVLPNDLHETDKLRISTGAYWPFLADTELEVQRTLGIAEYTDPHHAATVPHSLVLAPGLLIDKVYVGYWFWGRPSIYQLWADLQDLVRRIKSDFDPTTAEARAAWEASQVQTAARPTANSPAPRGRHARRARVAQPA